MVKIWVVFSLVVSIMVGIEFTPFYVAVRDNIDSEPGIFEQAKYLNDLPLLVVKDILKSVKFIIINREFEMFFEVFMKAFLFMLALPFLLAINLFFRVAGKIL